MRVIAFTFDESDAARAAREKLIEEFEMRPSDAMLAPVVDAEVVLAVRAREENLRAVKQILIGLGGQEATDIDEEWTGGP